MFDVERLKNTFRDRNVGIYVWKLGFFFLGRYDSFLIDATYFKECVLYLKSITYSKEYVWCLMTQPFYE